MKLNITKNRSNINFVTNGTNFEFNGKTLTDILYPIGSIYISTQATSPASLFGGTWEQIKDKFLLSSGDLYTLGAEGGEYEHTLTIEEMPSHSHGYTVSYLGANGGNGPSGNNMTGTIYSCLTNQTGNNVSHNNMPPYVVVKIWKRIS